VNGQRVLLLGLSYKRNTGDARESPSRPIARQLVELGRRCWWPIRTCTPTWCPTASPSSTPPPTSAASCAAVVVLVDHDAFDLAALIADAPYVLDTATASRATPSSTSDRPLPRGRMRADQNELTIRRIKRGKYYSFVRANGTPVRHTGTIKRLHSMACPRLCRSSLLPRSDSASAGRRPRRRGPAAIPLSRGLGKGSRTAQNAPAGAAGRSLAKIRRNVSMHLSGDVPTREFALAAVIELIGAPRSVRE